MTSPFELNVLYRYPAPGHVIYFWKLDERGLIINIIMSGLDESSSNAVLGGLYTESLVLGLVACTGKHGSAFINVKSERIYIRDEDASNAAKIMNF